ncbi:AT-hook motif nuclear-localized protein 14-like [Vigna radiata var. radiata]|uniref:AT-hook motif nuclear-localized protein 14-like n=1 Tax=Vigna radiata var. radiata TaxID=3916 RepID=A0A1S3VFY2_VIGRR|nr:AT-hook motif nuclear-localized protein 14-like [Vigna radiata var. radiata]
MTPPKRKPTNGSKKKSRSTSPMDESPESSVNVFTFNVAPNSDVMQCISDIASRDQVSVTVISATGKINKVTLKSSTNGEPDLMLHGPLTLVSLTGSYLYNNQYTLHPGATPPLSLSFGINLSTIGGKVFCGVVGGRVIAGENVKITVYTYTNPNILKYSAEGQEDSGNDNNDDENHKNNNFGDDQ